MEKRIVIKGENVQVSDGYHTFDELYEHRIELWMALCRLTAKEGRVPVWRTKTHSDGEVWPSWFLLGIGTDPGKQMTYHLPEYLWRDCAFAEILDRAPEFDGHSSGDVLLRLRMFKGVQ